MGIACCINENQQLGTFGHHGPNVSKGPLMRVGDLKAHGEVCCKTSACVCGKTCYVLFAVLCRLLTLTESLNHQSQVMVT